MNRSLLVPDAAAVRFGPALLPGPVVVPLDAPQHGLRVVGQADGEQGRPGSGRRPEVVAHRGSEPERDDPGQRSEGELGGGPVDQTLAVVCQVRLAITRATT